MYHLFKTNIEGTMLTSAVICWMYTVCVWGCVFVFFPLFLRCKLKKIHNFLDKLLTITKVRGMRIKIFVFVCLCAMIVSVCVCVCKCENVCVCVCVCGCDCVQLFIQRRDYCFQTQGKPQSSHHHYCSRRASWNSIGTSAPPVFNLNLFAKSAVQYANVLFFEKKQLLYCKYSCEYFCIISIMFGPFLVASSKLPNRSSRPHIQLSADLFVTSLLYGSSLTPANR